MENIDEEATTRAQAIPDVAQQLVVFRRYDSKGDSMINKRVAHHLRQIPSWGARDRQWVASLSLEPEELERLGHIKFQEGKDDLAALKYVFLELDGGPQLLLLKYENPHQPGTLVWAPSDAPNVKTELEGFLEALHLSKKDVLDQSPESA